VVRHSNSNVCGRIINNFGCAWQHAADLLHQLAVLHGSVAKIDISISQTHTGHLNFIIYFHANNSAQKFYEYTTNALWQGSSVECITYAQTPLQDATEEQNQTH
ncbi:unnamed protein product, partial [Adineta ricciae]